MTHHLRRSGALIGYCLLGVSLLGTLTVLIVRFTALQEHSARFMALSGMSTSVALACAALATVGAIAVGIGASGSLRCIAAVALVPCLVALQFTAPTVAGLVAPERSTDGVAFSVLVQNLWYRNQGIAATARSTLDHHATVVVLIEYTPAAAAAFRSAGSERLYPYRWALERPNGHGIAVLSTVPFGEPEDLGLSGPSARLDLRLPGADVVLYAIHTNSPSSLYDLPRWKADFDALNVALRNAVPNTVVAGDFNATSGHIRFRQVVRDGRLRDAQDAGGGGLVNTWPSGNRLPRLLQLDHILVGVEIGVEDFRTLAHVGSDHRGIEADLRATADG